MTLVSIFKTFSDQILSKSTIKGVAAALFSSRCPKNLEKEKNYLEIAEIDVGVNFGSRRTILDIKAQLFSS